MPPPPTPAAFTLRYEQATAGQQAQVLAYLQTRLSRHFPSLPPASWDSALDEFQPELLLADGQVTLSLEALTQLVQHLADLPEMALDPPIYGPAARYLAQRQLYWAELAVGALSELEATPAACGPQVYTLVQGLAQVHGMAETVVQAFVWGHHAGRPLPPGLPGGGPAPGSAAVQQRLRALAESCCHWPPPGQPPDFREPVTATGGIHCPLPISHTKTSSARDIHASVDMGAQQVAPATICPVSVSPGR